jgi:hypothetical protein
MNNEIEKQIFEKMKAKDFGESMCNETKLNVLKWTMQQLQVYRRSVLVEFFHNNHKVFDKTYWEDDKERYEDIKQWQSKSPMKRVRYVEQHLA